MAITSYIGLPGSGKSYSVVENVILPMIRKGRPVYTNLALNYDKIAADFPDSKVVAIDDQEVKENLSVLCEIEGGAVIVLDEAWRHWPQGQKWDRLTEEQQAFFTEHRHKAGGDGYTQEIVLIVQCNSLLAAGVRRLIDTTYISQKLDKVGAKNRFTVNVYHGAQTIERPNKARKVNELAGKYKPEIYQYYKSQTKSDQGLGHAMEEVADDRGVIWKSPAFKYGMPAALVIAILGAWNLYKFFNPEPTIEEDLVTPIPIEQMTGSSDQAKTPGHIQDIKPGTPGYQAMLPHYSQEWRLVGYFDARGAHQDKRYFIVEGRQGRRRIPWSQCRKDGMGGHKCKVDGQTVTNWTGPKPTVADSIRQQAGLTRQTPQA